jgi:hypothetical protein
VREEEVDPDSAPPASDYVPTQSRPLQPLLDQLDQLLKEPPAPAPEHRRGPRDPALLPANPY